MLMFPKALIACIAEARVPGDPEIVSVAEHIWNDAFGSITRLSWDRLGHDDGKRLWMLAVAHCAMCGATPSGGHRELARAVLHMEIGTRGMGAPANVER